MGGDNFVQNVFLCGEAVDVLGYLLYFGLALLNKVLGSLIVLGAEIRCIERGEWGDRV